MKLLLYCTKAKPYLKRYWFNGDNGSGFNYETSYCQNEEKECEENLNGKIVAECDFEVEEIIANDIKVYDEYGIEYTTKNGSSYMDNNFESLLNNSCLNAFELNDYLGGYGGYAIHIKNLHIFDKPRNIKNYYNIAPRTMQDCMNQRVLVKAPQNMCNAYDVYKNHYIVISIHPEWLCKILNGEKTIEVRKKVLKEML